MVVGAGRHLGQVGDGQHLPVAAELAHQAPDRLRDGAADAGVDLVEDQRLRRTQLAGGDGDGQRHARQFAARGDLGDRPWRAAGMAGDQEADVFQAGLHRLVGGCNCTSKRPPSMPRPCMAWVMALASSGATLARALDTALASRR